MKCLAIETATQSCSVALLVDGEVRQRISTSPRRHGELILPWADALLAEAGISRQQLDAVALSRGPGSFTSLRLGLSAGVAIAFALDLPVYPISSLAALAQNAAPQAQQQGFSHCYVLLDARMGEVYAAQFRFTDSGVATVSEELLVSPQHCPQPSVAGRWFGAGSGFALSEQEAVPLSLSQAILDWDAQVAPSATALLTLLSCTAAVSAETFQPVYLRDRVAHVPNR